MSGLAGEQNGKQTKIYWITVLQIMSMFLIVLSHSIPDNMTTPKWMTSTVSYLQNAGLTAFMWVSAYLTVKTRSIEKYGYIGFIKKRSLRLLVPYFACSILMMLPKMVIQGSTQPISVTGILYQLAVPREGILPHLWFLPTLFLLSCAMPIWRAILKDKRAALICLMVLLGIQFIPNITKLVCVDDVIRYAMWYFIGLMCAGNSFVKNAHMKRHLVICAAAFGGGIA